MNCPVMNWKVGLIMVLNTCTVFKLPSEKALKRTSNKQKNVKEKKNEDKRGTQ